MGTSIAMPPSSGGSTPVKNKATANDPNLKEGEKGLSDRSKSPRSTGVESTKNKAMSNDSEDQDFSHTKAGKMLEGTDLGYEKDTYIDDIYEEDEDEEGNLIQSKGKGQTTSRKKHGRHLPKNRKAVLNEILAKHKNKLSEKDFNVVYDKSQEKTKEDLINLKYAAKLARMKNLGSNLSLSASVDELVDHLKKFGNFNMKNISTEVLKNEVKKFLEDPLKRDLTIRAILLFMETVNESWFSELSSMKFVTKQQQETTLLEGEKNLDIGKQQLIMGAVTGAIGIISGGFSFVGSTKSLHKMRKATSEFKSTEINYRGAIQKNQQAIDGSKSKLNEIDSKLNAKNLDPEVKKKLQDKKAILQKSIKDNESEIKTIEDKINKASSVKDAKIREADVAAQQLQAASQILDSAKPIVEGAFNLKIAMSKKELKILESIQTGLQFESAKLKMCMQRSFDFVNSVWGTASSIVNSYYQAQKAIISS